MKKRVYGKTSILSYKQIQKYPCHPKSDINEINVALISKTSGKFKINFEITHSSPSMIPTSENNSVEVNFNIHVMTTSGVEESKNTNSGPIMTITSTSVDQPNDQNHTNSNGIMTNAQQNAMSNMFKQFFK